MNYKGKKMTEQPKLDPTVKTLWVEALRSGRFTQGTGALSTHAGGNCCLGVACELAVEQGVLSPDEVKELSPEDFATAGKSYNESTNYPPTNVVRWMFGLTDTPGEAEDYDAFVNPDAANYFNPLVSVRTPDGVRDTTHLAELNDAGADFELIAKLIEEQL